LAHFAFVQQLGCVNADR